MINISNPLIKKTLSNEKNVTFGSIKDSLHLNRREAHNYVEKLKENGPALSIAMKDRIGEALTILAQDSSDRNIEFLLDLAKNLTYGVKSNSAMADYLSKESSISAMPQKQNVDWEKELKKTIAKALEGNNSAQKASLQARLDTLNDASAPKSDKTSLLSSILILPGQEKMVAETELIELKETILNTPAVQTQATPEQKETITHYLDLFLASSEVSEFEKKECMRNLAYLGSDNYAINPQLADKKPQVMAELLNDLVLKDPSEMVLKTKDIDQQAWGSCAATSTTRKYLAHYQKLHYVQEVLRELNNQPAIKLHDPTSNVDEKIYADKSAINYIDCMNKGLRIVDAAAHNGMSIASITPTGRQVSHFSSTTPDQYDIFKDSFLWQDLPKELLPKQNVYRASIKFKEAFNAVKSHSKNQLQNLEREKSLLKDYSKNYHRAITAMYDDLKASLPGTSLQMLNSLQEAARNIANLRPYADGEFGNAYRIDSNSLDENAYDIDLTAPKDQQKAIIKAVLNDKIPQLLAKKESSKIDKLSERLLNVYKALKRENVEFEELKQKHSSKNDFAHFENLFHVAAYHRVVRSFELDDPEKLDEEAKRLQTDPNKEAVLEKLEEKGELFPKDQLDKIYDHLEKVNQYIFSRKQKGDDGWISNASLYAIPQELRNIAKTIDIRVDKLEEDLFGNAERDRLLKATKSRMKRKASNHLSKEEKKTLEEIKKAHPSRVGAAKKAIMPELEKLAYAVGEMTGHYWVGKEGSSGLFHQQTTSLANKVTGEKHYVSGDVDALVDDLYHGKGAVTATSVTNVGYGGHAQLAYRVKEVPYYNEETGKIETQMAIGHDNSWGRLESAKLTEDEAGNLITSYNRGRGGYHKFLYDPNSTQFTLRSDYLDGVGVSSLKELDKFAESPSKHSIMEFPYFKEFVKEGNFPFAQDYADIIHRKLFNIVNKNHEHFTDIYVDKLLAGNKSEASKLITNVAALAYDVAADAIDHSDTINVREALSKKLDEIIGAQNPSKAAKIFSSLEAKPLSINKEEIKTTKTLIDPSIFKPDCVDNLASSAKESYRKTVLDTLEKLINQAIKLNASTLEKKMFASKAIGQFVELETPHYLNYSESVNQDKPKAAYKHYQDMRKRVYDIIKGQHSSLAPGMDLKLTPYTQGITSRKDFDALMKLAALPKSDADDVDTGKVTDAKFLKLLLDKVGLHKLDETHHLLLLDAAKTLEDLKKVKDKYTELHIDSLKTLFDKKPAAYYDTLVDCRSSILHKFNSIKSLSQHSSQEIILSAFEKTYDAYMNELEKEQLLDGLLNPEKAEELKERDSKNYPGTTKIKKLSVPTSLADFKQEIHKINETIAEETLKNANRLGDHSLQSEIVERLDSITDEVIKKHTTIKEMKDIEEYPKAIAFIDRVFNPVDNDDFMEKVRLLQDMDHNQFVDLLAEKRLDELGIDTIDQYDFVRQVRSGSSEATEILNNILYSQAKNEVIPYLMDYDKVYTNQKGVVSLFNAFNGGETDTVVKSRVEEFYKKNATTDQMYDKLRDKLALMSLDRVVKANKGWAQSKYGVFPSIPTFQVMSEKEIAAKVNALLDPLEKKAVEYNKISAVNVQHEPAKKIQQEEMLKNLLSIIKEDLQYTTESFVRPRHQDDVLSLAKKWVKATTKNPESASAKGLKEQLTKALEKDYIVKYPDELLDYVTEKVPRLLEPSNDKKQVVLSVHDQRIMETLKENLSLCVEKAEKAQISFLMKSFTKEGSMNQIAQSLKKSEHILTDDKEIERKPLDTKEGIECVINALYDETNDNRALIDFIEHTGLVHGIHTFIADGPDPVKFADALDSNLNIIEDMKSYQTIFDRSCPKLLQKLGSKDSFADISQAAELFMTKVIEPRINDEDKSITGNGAIYKFAFNKLLEDKKTEILSNINVSDSYNKLEVLHKAALSDTLSQLKGQKISQAVISESVNSINETCKSVLKDLKNSDGKLEDDTVSAKAFSDRLEKITKSFIGIDDKSLPVIEAYKECLLKQKDNTINDILSQQKVESPEELLKELNSFAMKAQERHNELLITSLAKDYSFFKLAEKAVKATNGLVNTHDPLVADLNRQEKGLNQAISLFDAKKETMPQLVLNAVKEQGEILESKAKEASGEIGTLSYETLLKQTKQDFEKAYDQLIESINVGDTDSVTEHVSKLVLNNSPVLNGMLKKILLNPETPPEERLLTATLLGKKGHVEPLVTYLNSCMDSAGNIKENHRNDESMLTAIQQISAYKETFTPEIREKVNETFNSLYKAAFKPEQLNSFNVGLLNLLKGGTPDIAEDVEKTLTEVAISPDTTTNAKIVSLIALSSSDSEAVVPLLNNELMTIEDLTDSANEELKLLNCIVDCAKTVYSRHSWLKSGELTKNIVLYDYEDLAKRLKEEHGQDMSWKETLAKVAQILDELDIQTAKNIPNLLK